jgi:integrase
MSLYTRKESRYWWMYLEPTGQRKSTSYVVKASTSEQSRANKENALALYHKTITDLTSQQQTGKKPEIAFRAYADWYAKHVSAKHRGAEREAYALTTLTQHFRETPLSELTANDVSEWLTARAAQVTVGTANRELDVLKRMLKLSEKKYIDASPLVGFPRLRAQRGQKARPAAILTPAREAKLLAVLTPADRALVLLALCTLFRLSDLLDLKWTDYHRTWIEAFDTKTDRIVRVPVATRARKAVEAIPRAKNAVYLFPERRKGTPGERRNRIKMLLRRACERAKIPYGRAKGGITFHSFRHTGATRMVAAGVDLRTVQELGGWSRLDQVTRYAHPTDQTKRSAVEKI